MYYLLPKEKYELDKNWRRYLQHGFLSRTGNKKKNTFVGMNNEDVHQQSQKETRRHDTEVRASKLFLQAGTKISFLQVVAFHLDPGVGGPEHRHIPLPVWLYFCKG